MRRAWRARARAILVAAGTLASAAVSLAGEQIAFYSAAGSDSRLFDQYDNDGYSLSVAAGERGALELRVRVSDSPLASLSPFPTALPRDLALSPSAERDVFARSVTAGCGRQSCAVERILLGVAARVEYDPDTRRLQDPAAVFRSGRANCVGLAELSVDLLRRIGIRARTVQGLLRTEPGADGYDPRIGGSFHRWIEIHYPDRGYVFSDPSASVNGVDARYIPFGARSLLRPDSLEVRPLARSGRLAYGSIRAGRTTLRARALR